jgi:alanine dehydrogenase
MRIGVTKEVKFAELRVGMTPAGVGNLVQDGHQVSVEHGAGVGAGFDNEDYLRAGATLASAAEVWAGSELIVKVKEPIETEYQYLRPGQVLFTYLHLAANRPLTQALVDAGTTAIAYETVQIDSGLPLLTPMSEIAGRLASQAAAQYLLHPFGGPGILIGGSPGVAAARVVIIGGGVVGTQAALIALGLQAEVTIFDTSGRRIRELTDLFSGRARVLQSDPSTLMAELQTADVVIGAVLVPGALAPKVVRREHLTLLRPEVVLVDVAIDQGGCFETSRPTSYDEPIFRVEGRIHYCVANMPGAVPRTSTRALTNATLPYVRRLASQGFDAAIASDPALAKGVNIVAGRVIHEGVVTAFPDIKFKKVLGA